MTYQEALIYLTKPQWFGQKPGLERIGALMHALGDVHKKLRYVHVAGTNGKGSICAMLSSILCAAGYKTGLFTSPYIHRFNERYRVGGVCISDDALAAVTAEVKAAADGLGMEFTVFDLVTAAGFLWFAKEKCDIVVLETGLGGRFDATNIIDCPDCAVISNIGLDHTEVLGDTVEKIAAEKSGIIKPGGAVAMYQPDEDSGVAALIAGVCRERGASLRIAEFDELEMRSDDLDGQEFCYCDDVPLRLPLLGDHQLKNAAVVLEAVEILREKGFQKLSAEAVEQGLAETKWPARFELVHRSPFVIVDGGHNPQCGESVAVNMDYYFEESKKVFLVGMLADKDVDGFLAHIAPVADAFVCVRPNSPRALPAAVLAEKLKQYQKPTLVCESIAEGVKTAVAAAGKSGAVCATGSLYLVGDVRAAFGLNGVETEGAKR